MQSKWVPAISMTFQRRTAVVGQRRLQALPALPLVCFSLVGGFMGSVHSLVSITFSWTLAIIHASGLSLDSSKYTFVVPCEIVL